MTSPEVVAANDLLRTQFRGGLILFTPAVCDLPAQLRAKELTDAMSQALRGYVRTVGNGGFAHPSQTEQAAKRHGRVSIYPGLNQTNGSPELSKFQSSARTPIDVFRFHLGD